MNEEIKKYIDSQYRFILDSLRDKHLRIENSLDDLKERIEIQRHRVLDEVHKEACLILKDAIQYQMVDLEDKISRLNARASDISDLKLSLKGFKKDFNNAQEFFSRLQDLHLEFADKFSKQRPRHE